VSSDHSYGFFHVAPVFGNRIGGSLAGEHGVDYLSNPDGSYELVGIGSEGTEPLAQGRYISPGGSHVIFSTGRQVGQSGWCSGKPVEDCEVRRLDPDAAPTGTGTVYDREADGNAHAVSLLPPNVPQVAGQEAFYRGASKNGTSIAFTVEGTLYVRVNSGESGEETEEVASGGVGYAGLSNNGKYLFYVAGGEKGVIHRFETGTEADVAINPGAEGEVVNVSADGSHVYFVSGDSLTGPQENSNGDVALPPANGTGNLSAAEGSGTLSEGSTTVSGVTTSNGSFEVGMQVSSAGAGIQAGTTIEGVGAGTLTLSEPATVSGTRFLSAGSTVINGVSTTEGTFLPGMAIEGAGIPVRTEIVAVGAGTLTLSKVATEMGARSLAAYWPNLYVWNGTSVTFVATVASSDLERTSGGLEGVPALTRWTAAQRPGDSGESGAVAPENESEVGPGAESSRTTTDGKVLVFESKAQLTGYENVGHTEIYRWDEAGKGLVCISCAGPEPATKDARLQELQFVGQPVVIHNVTDDGSRVFFETEQDLSADDTDEGVNDIYQWTEGSLGGPELISSGRSEAYPLARESKGLPTPNVLLSVSPDGKDVVFTAQDVLVPGAGEGGTQAIYDARVNGGFRLPPAAPPPCAKDGCKGAPSSARTASSVESQSDKTAGKGNVKPKRKNRCHSSQKKKGGDAHRCKRRHGKKHHHAGKRPVARLSTSPLPAVSPSGDTANTDQTQSPSASTAPGTQALIGSFEDFGIESLSGSVSTNAAGSHPDFTASFSLTHGTRDGLPYADAHAEEITVSLPPGLLGNPNATPRCHTGEFVAFGNCPTNSQVGVARVLVTNQRQVLEPIYNLVPPHPNQEVARLGFIAFLLPTFIDVKVRTASDYGVTATVHSSPSLSGVLASEAILWGNPADSSHDAQRLTALEVVKCATPEVACEAPGGERPSTIPVGERKAFMSNPSSCEQGQLALRVTSYQLPGKVFEKSAAMEPITDCSGLPFSPSFSAEPTSHVAGAPTGLETKLVVPQHLGEDERATATMREARITLPAGMQIAAGAANWIATCSDQQVGFHEEVDAACPDASKVGTATFTSPALPDAIEGAVYQRAPSPGRQFGLWLVADQLGLHVKLPGELEPDKQTGRLTAVFRDLPQVPVSEIDLDVWGGDRAPLQNPDSCGTYATDFSFSPHSKDPVAAGTTQMRIDEGCSQAFDPKLKAGVTNPVAGKYSPLVVDLTRADSDQGLRGFEITLPDGELAKIKGVARCPDAAAEAGACPEASRIGTVTAVTGPGPDPLSIPQPGKPTPAVFLGGPYKGSPLSVVTIAPAQAGPFDLGNLVVRSGLGLDPDTNRAVVKADPLPQFFEGVGLSYRRLHVVVDRPDFSLNPTDCREMAVDSTVTSTQGVIAHPSTRFQVDGCKALKFAPRLTLTLTGGTKRADYPALTATLKARMGDANIARASVALPHSEFLAQEHIGTICTRKQFAAHTCPKRSVYGMATAWTPLLAKPLSGPVYLRSSDHVLPDLVAALSGELDVNLVGRIDSTKAGGIRTTFEGVPDAPVKKFVLRMRGGDKGLITNSTNVCRGSHRAKAVFKAQNGRASSLRPELEFKGCGKPKR
jgi:hypothetical protein